MEWEKILRNAVKDGKIRESALKKIPVLKNCENWRHVKPVGRIDHSMKFSHYRGIIVMLNDKIYFVSDNTIDALSEFVTWNIKKRIDVVEKE